MALPFLMAVLPFISDDREELIIIIIQLLSNAGACLSHSKAVSIRNLLTQWFSTVFVMYPSDNILSIKYPLTVITNKIIRKVL